MIVEIITTGTELLLGQVVNTNSAYLANQLNKLGFDVLYHSTIGDNKKRMKETLLLALARADIVITTGGMGPTQGDITKEITAEVLNRDLHLHKPSLANIERYFAKVKRTMVESNIRQAMIPDSAVVLENYCGTAPGVVLEDNGKMIINLPGPPRELKMMFEKCLKPFLIEKFGCSKIILSRVLNTYGIGESLLEEKIKELILQQHNPTIALLARKTGVIVRLTAKADNEAEALTLIKPLEAEIKSRIGEFIYAVDDIKLEEVVAKQFVENKLTVAMAESCTGGLLTSRLTDIPGSSAYVVGAIVSYSDIVKINELNIAETLINEKGAVSEEVAKAMAEGVRKKLNSKVGIAITGFAGPGGDSHSAEVGLVYLSLSDGKKTICEKKVFHGQRLDIKFHASQAALNLLWQYNKKNNKGK